jgi:hypothetical protein
MLMGQSGLDPALRNTPRKGEVEASQVVYKAPIASVYHRFIEFAFKKHSYTFRQAFDTNKAIYDCYKVQGPNSPRIFKK